MDKTKALNKAMELCSKKEVSEFDIKQKLVKWGVDEKHENEIIQQLIHDKFIDDQRFAKAYVNDKFRFNHWGKIKIKMYLRHKQIDEKTINQALDGIDEEQYFGILKSELAKKERTVQGKNLYEIKNKVAKYVISKGFEPSIVFNAIGQKYDE